jgi:hypothetical protein
MGLSERLYGSSLFGSARSGHTSGIPHVVRVNAYNNSEGKETVHIKRFIITSALVLPALLVVGLLFARPDVTGAAPRNAGIPEIMIHGHDFAFSGPDQIEAGLVAVTLMNDGHEPHQANVARFKDGKTISDFAAALKQSPAAGLALVDFVGGPNTVAPGGIQRVVMRLEAGDYVLLCFVPSPDGVPHLA